MKLRPGKYLVTAKKPEGVYVTGAGWIKVVKCVMIVESGKKEVEIYEKARVLLRISISSAERYLDIRRINDIGEKRR